MRRSAAMLLFVIGTSPLVAQSRAAEPSGPNIKKLTTFDSGNVQNAVLSRDGRWVAFAAQGSLWTVSADGHGQPVRITSPGYTDRVPYWLPSNDGLTFTSNRTSRNGGNRFYGMTIAIDPNTGRASGSPRAVTTDEVFFMGHASPDGKWIAYVTATGDSLKIVPAGGGTAKFLTKLPAGSATPPIWYPDGKTIAFASPLRPKGNLRKWYRVAASGGTPEPVEHAPPTRGVHAHDQLEQPTKHLDLRDSTDRIVSTIEVPNGMSVEVFGAANAALGTMNVHHYVSHIYSVETGAHRVIDGWSDGWTSDGKNFLIELTDVQPGGSPGRAVAAGLADNSGRIISRAPLPDDAGGCCAWSGVVGNSFTVGRRSSSAILVADAQSGRLWELAPETFDHDTWRMPIVGRGGQGFSDDGRFLYTTLTPQSIDVRAGNAENKSMLLRSFSTKDSAWQPKNLNGSHAIAVIGDRVAWTDRTRDSVIVWVVHGPTGSPRRVTALASPKCSGGWQGAPCHTELVWSQRGDALALVTEDETPVAAVLRVRADGSLEGAPTILQPNVRQPWCVRWVDGDRALAMIGRREREADDVFVVPINPASPSRVLTHGGAGEWMWVSPNGKELLFPEVITTGSSIWRLDFVPANAGASAARPKPE